jgi:hypothetical protein
MKGVTNGEYLEAKREWKFGGQRNRARIRNEGELNIYIHT